MKTNKIFVIIIAGVVMFGAIFAFTGFSIKRADMRKKARCTYEVTATVTENSLERSTDNDGNTSRSYHPVYEYTYNGETFVIKSSSGSNPPVFEVGEEVTAYVNPLKPQEIYVPADNTVRTVSTVFMLVGILVAAMGIIIPTTVAILMMKKAKGGNTKPNAAPARVSARRENEYTSADDEPYDKYDDYGGRDEYDDTDRLEYSDKYEDR
ncbi:MAG: DUF3592 domain-containing protein [Ruminococcus sp.]|nr:DUF3592 domain-containing protein [Ruminococcus sp.]